MISPISFLSSLLCLTYLTSALPILPKREVVTRVHTASTTNVVTDFYSTTTEVVIAPTVEFLISDSVTFTTTLIPQGVNPTAEPTTTITKVLLKKAEMSTSSQPTSTLQPSTIPQSTSSFQAESTLQAVSTQQTAMSVSAGTSEDVQQLATTSTSISSSPCPTTTSTSTQNREWCR